MREPRFILVSLVIMLVFALPNHTPALATEPCGNWSAVESPNPSIVNRVLDVTGRSPDDLWLLGGAGPTYPPITMIWHRQGSGWTTIPLPDTSPIGWLPSFNAITQLPNGDVLVGGEVGTSYPIYNQPFVARWNGSQWVDVLAITLRPQTVYPYGARGGFIYEFFVAGPDDIWALGNAASMGYGGSVAMAVHFDGSSWTEVETPIVGNRTNQIIAADGSGPNDIWAVGVYRDIAGAYTPFTMHWDGSSWTYHAGPTGATGSFDAAAVISPTDAWALGVSVFVHWDGVAWQPAPKPSGASSAAIEALASDDVWVAHMTNGYFHWNGATWAFADGPVTPAPGEFAQVRDFVSVGPCDVWAAGSFLLLNGGEASATLVQRLTTVVPLIGDLNCDGAVDFGDINPFVLALTNPGAYATAYPGCDILNGDINGDGSVDFADIDPFVVLLAAG